MLLNDLFCTDRPKEGVLREVELDTSFDHLGIQIQEHPGTGIFITSVSHNSLAAEVGIEVDDQIIEVRISSFIFITWGCCHCSHFHDLVSINP